MSEINQLKNFSPALAAELAMGLIPPHEVFEQHGYTKQEAQELLQNPYFDEMVKQAKRDWDSMSNVQQRLQAKARLALEEGLVDLYKILSNNKEGAQARVAAAKELKDIAKIQNETTNTTGGLPSIQIFLNGDQPVQVGGETVEHQDHKPGPGDDLRSLFGASNNDDLVDDRGTGSRSGNEVPPGSGLVEVDLS
jgi:hypothetical protein